MPLVQFSAPSARKIIEIANEFEPVQDGRIHIEKINRPMLFELKATPAEYRAGLERDRQGMADAARKRSLCPAH
jgi:hypothetical protein